MGSSVEDCISEVADGNEGVVARLRKDRLAMLGGVLVAMRAFDHGDTEGEGEQGEIGASRRPGRWFRVTHRCCGCRIRAVFAGCVIRGAQMEDAWRPVECAMIRLVVAGVRSRNIVFFFQAEDGIRDYKVTGVQTCALPICEIVGPVDLERGAAQPEVAAEDGGRLDAAAEGVAQRVDLVLRELRADRRERQRQRSEERRVGKECRSRWSPYH